MKMLKMKMLLASLVATCIALTSLGAGATPITVGPWYEFAFGGPGTALVNGAGTSATVPASLTAPDPPWTFTLSTAGTLTVLDLFISADQFEIFNFGLSLGLTSVPTSGGACGGNIACALADLDYSRGIFNLAAGSYSITGLQTIGTPGAAVFQVTTAAVPEPGTLLLFILGIGLSGGLWFIRRTA